MRGVRLALVIACTPGCSASDVEPDAAMAADGAPLYAQVAALIDRSCAKQVCHGDMVANAHLDFMVDDFRASVVGVPSCEYERMSRVEPGDPDASWLMIKLAGAQRFVESMDFVDFTPASGWTAPNPECSGTLPDGAPWFGTRMPPVASTQPLSDAEVALVRAWIAAGAAGR